MESPKKKVLIMDREEKILSTAKELLAKENYELFTHSDVDKAFDFIDENGPLAVVVCDDQMSGMEGTEFFEKLKSLAPDTVRVLMAENHDAQFMEKVVNTGEVFRFLKKPLDFQVLQQTIEVGIEENEKILQLKVQGEEHGKLSIEKVALESEALQLGSNVQSLTQMKNRLIYAMVAIVFCFGLFEVYSGWAKNAKLEDTSQKIGSWIKYTDGTAKDTTTGLMWMVRDFRILERRQPQNWQEAIAWVGKINEERYAGYSNWRTPTIDEYRAIYDENGKQLAYDQKKDFVLGNPTVFESGGGYAFWSQNEIGMKSARYFFFLGGYSEADLKSYDNRILSIRLVRNY